ncbi:MAG: hypothetical protein E6X17_17650 [Sporomusaceae bacterium]|nr:hypothetical protein [Sporomusaceae bacterium]
MDYKIDRVEAVRSASKIIAARPVGDFDSLLQQQSNPKKQRGSRPSGVKRNPVAGKTGCELRQDGIDCSV